MTISFKNDNKAPLVVPPAVRRRARFESGQELEFRASGGVIAIVPKLPAATDEYTQTQRRVIDAELREAEKGPFYGPFDTMDEMIAHLRKLGEAQAREKDQDLLMKAEYGEAVKRALDDAPAAVRKAFFKQLNFLKGTFGTPPSIPRSTMRPPEFGRPG